MSRRKKNQKTITNALKMNTRRIVIHASLSDNKYMFSQNKTVTEGEKNQINDSILKQWLDWPPKYHWQQFNQINIL